MKTHTSLKVCGLKHKNNLLDVISAGVDYVGMIFYEKSPRYMVDTLFPEDVWFLPDEVEKIGVFVHADKAYIEKYARLYQLDIIQLHGNESVDFCKQIQDLGYPVIKAFGVDDTFDFSVVEAYRHAVDFFLFDTKSNQYGGSGKSFDWNLLNQYHGDIPFFLGGGVSIDQLPDILCRPLPKLFAVDMNSRLETEPGLKDITLVKEAVRLIHEDG